MKKQLRLFGVDLHRALCSRIFLLSILGIAVLMFVSSYQYIHWGEDGVSQDDVVGITSIAFTGSSLPEITAAIVCLFPFAVSYADDISENSAAFFMIRAGVGRYAASKYITAMVSGFLTMVLGILLYTSFLSVHLPVFSGVYQSGDACGFDRFLYEGRPLLYFLCFAVVRGLSAAVCCGACVWISSIFPNRFTALIGPVVLYLFLLRFDQGMFIPLQYSIANLVESDYGMGTPLATIGYKLLYISVFAIPMGLNAAGNMKRRLRNA